MVKICHNLLLGVIAQSLAEITVCRERRCSTARVPRVHRQQRRRLDVLALKTPAFVNLDWTPTFTPVLLRKDLDLGLKAAKALGVSLPVTQVTRDIVDEAVEAGHTDCDFAILLDQQAKKSRLELRSGTSRSTTGSRRSPRAVTMPQRIAESAPEPQPFFAYSTPRGPLSIGGAVLALARAHVAALAERLLRWRPWSSSSGSAAAAGGGV